MEFKGSAAVVIPQFIQKKFGNEAYEKWLGALSPQSREIFGKGVIECQWYPLKQAMSEPLQKVCELFCQGNVAGAYECGIYSADYALKGIYKFFIQFGSPEFIINKASGILTTYYTPSSISVDSLGKGSVILRIIQFAEMDRYVEERIRGWMFRALELSGTKSPSVTMGKSLANGDPCSEFQVTWKA
jgi:hypothetical protein